MATWDQYAQERGWLAGLVGLDQPGSGTRNVGLVWIELGPVGAASSNRD